MKTEKIIYLIFVYRNPEYCKLFGNLIPDLQITHGVSDISICAVSGNTTDELTANAKEAYSLKISDVHRSCNIFVVTEDIKIPKLRGFYKGIKFTKDMSLQEFLVRLDKSK